jgi:hypothetical protein
VAMIAIFLQNRHNIVDLNIKQEILYSKIGTPTYFELDKEDNDLSPTLVEGILTPLILTLYNALNILKTEGIQDNFKALIEIGNYFMIYFDTAKFLKKGDQKKLKVDPNIYGNVEELMPLNLIYKILKFSSETEENQKIRELFYVIYQRTNDINIIKLNNNPEFYKTILSFVTDQNFKTMFPTDMVVDKNNNKNDQNKTIILFLAEISKELNHGNKKNLLSHELLKCKIYNLISFPKQKKCSKK